MSKAEYLSHANANGYVRDTAGSTELMRLRRAVAHGFKLSMVYDIDGKLSKFTAEIASYMPYAYRDRDDDVLFLVDLVFDGPDPSDDGIQAIWLKDMAALGDAPVEGNWVFEGDHALLDAGCPRCRWRGCARCRTP